MKYTGFEITNFKGIKEATIEFNENKILTLVGLNESGKTTILNAISLFHSIIKEAQPTIEDLRDFRPKGIAFSGKIIIKSKIKLEEIDKKELRKLYKSLGKRSKLVIGDTFEYSYVFHYKLHEHFKTRVVPQICPIRPGIFHFTPTR